MFKHVLVAVDYSDCAFNALEIAADLAISQHAAFDILTVIDPMQAVPPVGDPYGAMQPWLGALNDDAVKLLDDSTAAVQKTGLTVKKTLLDGPPAATIVEFAQRISADLIVIGSHGRKGLSRMMLGSVAESVMRDARCPVLVVHDSSKASSNAKRPDDHSSKASTAPAAAR
ncbi:MAG TPA: universal stress protein [Candidatus Baltobacteraceae bacterium]